MKRQEKRSTKATANSSICLWCLWPCPCLLLPFIRVSLSCLSQISARNTYMPATRTSALDIYSILLSVTDLCATYKYSCSFVYLPSSTCTLQISTLRGSCNLSTTSSQVSQTSHRLYHPLLALVRTL